MISEKEFEMLWNRLDPRIGTMTYSDEFEDMTIFKSINYDLQMLYIIYTGLDIEKSLENYLEKEKLPDYVIHERDGIRKELGFPKNDTNDVELDKYVHEFSKHLIIADETRKYFEGAGYNVYDNGLQLEIMPKYKLTDRLKHPIKTMKKNPVCLVDYDDELSSIMLIFKGIKLEPLDFEDSENGCESRFKKAIELSSDDGFPVAIGYGKHLLNFVERYS